MNTTALTEQWAEGRPWTAGELVDLYHVYCAEEQAANREPEDFQVWAEEEFDILLARRTP